MTHIVVYFKHNNQISVSLEDPSDSECHLSVSEIMAPDAQRHLGNDHPLVLYLAVIRLTKINLG